MTTFLSHVACAIKYFLILVLLLIIGGLFWMIFFGTGYILGYSIGNETCAVLAGVFWMLVFIIGVAYIAVWAFENSSC